ncbi:histidinol-phosphatase [bacterium]
MELPKHLMDYHLHTYRCHHADGDMIEYVESAVQLGITSIGFADHAPTQDHFDSEHRMSWHELENYVMEIENLRKQFSALTIFTGIEVDLYPGFEENLYELQSNFPIDYIIGSVHYVADQLIFNLHENNNLKKSHQSCLDEYLRGMHIGISSGMLDVIGHLDVIKYLFPDDINTVHDALLPLFPLISKNNLIVELNTSGFRKQPKQAFPDPIILKSLAQSKIPICLGSDAHQSNEVGMDYDKAMSLLHDIEYNCKSINNSQLHCYITE